MSEARPIFHLTRGQSRLLISIPHAGVFIPADIAEQLNPLGREVKDTDWHVDRLYAFAADQGATLLVATHSRTVVDLNRAPSGSKLYPGQLETTICPTECFDGAPLYDGPPPSPEEIARRIAIYWHPYHAALGAELDRIRRLHGAVHLLDGHSIRGTIPRLFPGMLPDLNYGTNSGLSAAVALVRRALAATEGHGFTQILDGRFRGGHITRHHGAPADGVHALQLELNQDTYMDAPSPYNTTRAARLIDVLRRLVSVLQEP